MTKDEACEKRVPTPEMFKLKTPCADCPFRKEGGVRHGGLPAFAYASYFVQGDGATFPCHRSVPARTERGSWSKWQDGQVMCAGGLILAEKVHMRSRTIQACINTGAHDPAT